MKQCAVTGAAGFVGGEIARHFARNGWRVLHLGRRRPSGEEPFCPYDLLADPEALPWGEIDVLVHCAWDLGLKRWEEIERVNVQGSIRILRAARAHGVARVVFISSFSSFAGCRSLYGRAKLLVEAEAARLGYAVVRPGLVYGDRSGGIVGLMEKAVQKARVLPLIGDGSYPQYPVHVGDVAELVFRVGSAEEAFAGKPLSAAPSEPVSFRQILERIAARTGRRLWCVPVPWRLIDAGLRGIEFLKLPFPFRRDSLTGIVFQNPHPDFELPPALAVPFRPFP
ncbi:MAG: NAD(P)-dependent oxidoreductase [Verrucomicrobiota bacterium]